MVSKKGFSNFTVKKNELYDVLLRTLKNYHFMRMKKSASYIKVLIQDANFLFKRGLYKQAKKNLKEARKMAEKCGDTLSLMEIMGCVIGSLQVYSGTTPAKRIPDNSAISFFHVVMSSTQN